MALVIVAGPSGQHAAVIYEAALLAGMAVAGFATFTDDMPPTVLDCPPLGPVDALAEAPATFVIACGDNALRRRYDAMLRARGYEAAAVVHPAAIVSPSAVVGAGGVAKQSFAKFPYQFQSKNHHK